MPIGESRGPAHLSATPQARRRQRDVGQMWVVDIHRDSSPTWLATFRTASAMIRTADSSGPMCRRSTAPMNMPARGLSSPSPKKLFPTTSLGKALAGMPGILTGFIIITSTSQPSLCSVLKRPGSNRLTGPLPVLQDHLQVGHLNDMPSPEEWPQVTDPCVAALRGRLPWEGVLS